MIKVWLIMAYYYHGAVMMPIEYPTQQRCRDALIHFKADNVSTDLLGPKKGDGKFSSAACIPVAR